MVTDWDAGPRGGTRFFSVFSAQCAEPSEPAIFTRIRCPYIVTDAYPGSKVNLLREITALLPGRPKAGLGSDDLLIFPVAARVVAPASV
jgi:hypothetical protein